MADPGTTILVADDDEDIRELVAYRLGKSGYDVVTANDGAAAFDLALEHRPAVAILDVLMPKLTGLELTRKLRAEGSTAQTAIILLSASVQESDIQLGFEAGADDYLKKPFSPQELRARVQAVLARR
ncbi:MAG: response regulator transcription factor [Actinomycetota bacterium]